MVISGKMKRDCCRLPRVRALSLPRASSSTKSYSRSPTRLISPIPALPLFGVLAAVSLVVTAASAPTPPPPPVRGSMTFNVIGGMGQCFAYAKLAELPVGPFVAVGATNDPYMVSAPWVNLTAAQGTKGVNCTGVTTDPCTCSWYAGGLAAGSPVFQFAGQPGECYAIGQVNQRTLAMVDPAAPGVNPVPFLASAFKSGHNNGARELACCILQDNASVAD